METKNLAVIVDRTPRVKMWKQPATRKLQFKGPACVGREEKVACLFEGVQVALKKKTVATRISSTCSFEPCRMRAGRAGYVRRLGAMSRLSLQVRRLGVGP